jgi:hypothetical protein
MGLRVGRERWGVVVAAFLEGVGGRAVRGV